MHPRMSLTCAAAALLCGNAPEVPEAWLATVTLQATNARLAGALATDRVTRTAIGAVWIAMACTYGTGDRSSWHHQLPKLFVYPQVTIQLYTDIRHCSRASANMISVKFISIDHVINPLIIQKNSKLKFICAAPVGKSGNIDIAGYAHAFITLLRSWKAAGWDS